MTPPTSKEFQLFQDPGLEVQKARGAKQLTVLELEEKLKLPPGALPQIEANKLDRPEEMTFMMGYIRSIASELSLDAELLMASYLNLVAPEYYAQSKVKRKIDVRNPSHEVEEPSGYSKKTIVKFLFVTAVLTAVVFGLFLR